MDAFRQYLDTHGMTLKQAAERLQRSLSAVKSWGTTRPYPAGILPAIEAMTGSAVQGRQLRPDLYRTENPPSPLEKHPTPVGKLP